MVRLLVVVAAVLAISFSATADENWYAEAYVCSGPHQYDDCFPARITLVDPPVSFDCYVVFDCFETGITGAVLSVVHTGGVLELESYDLSTFHEEAATISGGPGHPDGWVISVPECVFPNPSGVIVVARLSYRWLGGSGGVSISGHPSEGQKTLDCSGLPDEFCVTVNLGVNQDPPSTWPDIDCYYCYDPVEPSTWGVVKALYR